jgi:hypothetical protein
MAEKTGSFYGLELEVYSTLIEKKSIKNEKDLLKFLEELLFDFNDYRETHAVSDSSTFGGDFGDKDFVIKSKVLGNLLSPPTKKFPIQLIQCHFASDAAYNFSYNNNTLPLDVEYKMFDDLKIITSVKQKNKIINMELNSTGGTWSSKVMLRNLNKEGKEVGRFVEGLIPSGQSDRQEGHHDEPACAAAAADCVRARQADAVERRADER